MRSEERGRSPFLTQIFDTIRLKHCGAAGAAPAAPVSQKGPNEGGA